MILFLRSRVESNFEEMRYFLPQCKYKVSTWLIVLVAGDSIYFLAWQMSRQNFRCFFAQRLKKSQGLSFENPNNIVPDCFCNYSILQKLKKLYLHLLDLGKTFSVFSLCFGPYREYMYALTCQSKHQTHLTV